MRVCVGGCVSVAVAIVKRPVLPLYVGSIEIMINIIIMSARVG